MSSLPRSIRLFNQTLHSHLQLRPNFLPGGGTPDLILYLDSDPDRDERLSGDRRRGIAPIEINFTRPSRLEFRLYPESIRCHPFASDSIQTEIAFLGQVMAVWMESRGVLMLHAGAVEIDGQAVGFLGRNGAGKSTLTSLFVADGATLVTDDVLAVAHKDEQYEAWPSYPSMRMWPKTAQMVGIDHEPLVRVHPMLEKRYVPVGTGVFGTFRDRPVPLRRLYLLDERCSRNQAKIEPVMIGEAIFGLAKHSFAGKRLHSLGATAQRFNALSALASKAFVRRLSVPEGVEHFCAVRASIEKDLVEEA